MMGKEQVTRDVIKERRKREAVHTNKNLMSHHSQKMQLVGDQLVIQISST